MPQPGFKDVVIPEGLYQALEEYVRSSNGRYVSISEVVREALRDFFKRQLA